MKTVARQLYNKGRHIATVGNTKKEGAVRKGKIVELFRCVWLRIFLKVRAHYRIGGEKDTQPAALGFSRSSRNGDP